MIKSFSLSAVVFLMFVGAAIGQTTILNEVTIHMVQEIEVLDNGGPVATSTMLSTYVQPTNTSPKLTYVACRFEGQVLTTSGTPFPSTSWTYNEIWTVYTDAAGADFICKKIEYDAGNLANAIGIDQRVTYTPF